MYTTLIPVSTLAANLDAPADMARAQEFGRREPLLDVRASSLFEE